EPRGCREPVLRKDLPLHMEDTGKHLRIVDAFFSAQIAQLRREQAEMVQFFMQVGNGDRFLQIVNSITANSTVEDVHTIVRGMKVFESDAFVQERGCFALITLCEINNKNGGAAPVAA